MRTFILAVSAALMLTGSGAPLLTGAASSSQEPLPADLDRLLAPIALYPDQLLAQMLMCATDPVGVKALDDFLKSQCDAQGDRAAGCRGEGQVRTELRGAGAFPDKS